MKLKYLILSILMAGILLNSCSNKISEQLAQLSGEKVDAAYIYPDKAFFVFSIPEKNNWQWYKADTREKQSEYSWRAIFNLNGNSYSTGFHLFKPPFPVEPQEGSFKELIEAGQVDVGYKDQLDSNTRANAIIQPNRLIIVLRGNDIINKLKEVGPDSIQFLTQEDYGTFNRKKVKVQYSLTQNE